MTNKVYTEKGTNEQRTRVSDREGDETNRKKQQIYAMSFLLNDRQPYLEPFHGCSSCCHHFSLCIFKRKIKTRPHPDAYFRRLAFIQSIPLFQRSGMPIFQDSNEIYRCVLNSWSFARLEYTNTSTVRAKKKPTGFVFNKRAMCVFMFNCGRLFGVCFFSLREFYVRQSAKNIGPRT